ncbi:MAG: hypothetical protein AAF922_13410 [Pseudomonadota bacterium]
MMKFLFAAVLIGLTPISAFASQSELAQSIMDAGTSRSDERKTSVLLKDCMVQTQVFQTFEDQGFVLHSRFEFDLRFTEIILIDQTRAEYFFSFDTDTEGQKSALFSFRTVKPYMALHEMPNYRIRKNEDGSDPHVRTPSQRSGADGYHFIENHDFVFIMENLYSVEQARTFVSELRNYQKEYCRLLG